MNLIPPVNKAEYYERLKLLAHSVRCTHGLTTDTISLSSMRKVYKEEGIQIDYWPKLKKVRGAYLVVEDAPYVMINAAIKPKEPKIFIMAHELKHHLTDYELAKSGGLECSFDDGPPEEIGAGIFASEFIYPEAECSQLIFDLGITPDNCTPKSVVNLKRTCPAPVSYSFLLKRLERAQIIPRGSYAGIKFLNLEQEMYGKPWYLKRRIKK